MASYSIQDIAQWVHGTVDAADASIAVNHLVTDTRKITDPAGSVFFAIQGEHRDGHRFIPEAWQQGVRVFVVTEPGLRRQYPDGSFILVEDTLRALQQLAAMHRGRFSYPVIGIAPGTYVHG